MPRKVTLDKDLCISCGVCNSICPAAFDWDDDGKMKAVSEDLIDELASETLEAEASCPTGAIAVK